MFKHKEVENEMSGGQAFGYILIVAAILFVIAFLVFVILDKVGVDTARKDNGVTTTYSTEQVGELYETY